MNYFLCPRRYYCTLEVTLSNISLNPYHRIKMEFGQILVQLMTNISVQLMANNANLFFALLR